MKKPNKKQLLIIGGAVATIGGVMYLRHKRRQQQTSEENALYAPVTYYSPGQETYGNSGNYLTGGGAPSGPGSPGTVTAPVISLHERLLKQFIEDKEHRENPSHQERIEKVLHGERNPEITYPRRERIVAKPILGP